MYNPDTYDLLEEHLTKAEIKKLRRNERQNKKMKNKKCRQNPEQDSRWVPEYKPVQGKTPRQERLIEYINTFDQVVVYGLAGTGKTYVSACRAAEMFLNEQIEKIILTRPNVACGPSLGFFPGTLEEKMDPWLAPFKVAFIEKFGEGLFKALLRNETIQIVPFETMRGHSFSNAFVLCDEMQNASIEQMKCLLTRTGENTKMVLNGDTNQCDLNQTDSGLAYIIYILETNPSISKHVAKVEFNIDDVVRSKVCKEWLKAFNYENGNYLRNKNG